MILEYYTEKSQSLVAIRKASGGPNDGVHGLTPAQQLRVLSASGVHHYKYAVGIDYNFILNKAVNVGPVIVYVGYRGYPLNGNNRCGTSYRAVVGGKTDCTFNGAHAVLAIGMKRIAKPDGTLIRWDAIMRDPDHNSSARPEKPPYDQFPQQSLGEAMKHLVTDTDWNHTGCLYPTLKKVL
jgi:hypothetical protein